MRLNDTELIALSAIVAQQTVLMAAENRLRRMKGLSPAYSEELTEEAQRLQEELHFRKEEYDKPLFEEQKGFDYET